MLDKQDTLGFLFGRVCRYHYNRARQLLDKVGLHRGQPPVLFALSRQDGLTHSELATILEVTPATITNMVKRIEAAGFVVRRRDDADERVSRVYLTASGREIQAEIEGIVQEMEGTVFAGMSAEEQDMLRRLLTQMVANLQQAIAEEEQLKETE